MPTELPQHFGHVARPGEIVFQMDCDYPGIVIGNAYFMENLTFAEKSAVKNVIKDAPTRTQEEQLLRFEDAMTRTLGMYQSQIAKSESLPVELTMQKKEMLSMLDTEILMLETEQDAIKAEISATKTPEMAVFEHYESKIVRADKKIQDVREDMRKLLESPEYDPASEADAIKMKRLESAIESCNRAKGFCTAQRDFLINNLLGKPYKSLENAPDNCVPITGAIPVGEIIHLRNKDGRGVRIHGLISYDLHLTMNDHTVIMTKAARATLARTSEANAKRAREGDTIILDGRRKLVIVNPSGETLSEMKSARKSQIEQDQELTEKSHNVKWPKSVNGEEIKVGANIGYADDMKAVNAVNAPAVGLFRTDFVEGDLDVWKSIFANVAHQSIDFGRKGAVKSVTVRTADLVGDKKRGMTPEQRDQLIKDQLEAVHEVSKKYPKTFHIMFPQIDTPRDFAKYVGWATEAAEKTDHKLLKCGSMIESVSAVTLLDEICKNVKLAFISVGTNDLIANVLNYDRYGPEANAKYDPTDLAVIKTLETIIQKAEANNMPVGVCGDMASEPRYLALLIGLGYRHISSAVGFVPRIKELASRIDTDKATALVDLIKNPDLSRAEREEILDTFNERELGLHPDGQIEMKWPPENDAPAAAATPKDA